MTEPRAHWANPRAVFQGNETQDWYRPVLVGPSTLGERASSSACVQRAADVLTRLDADDYVEYLLGYYRAGLDRFGETWRYADLATVLLAVAELLAPRSYLEIGVRRGRSMAMVAATCPDSDIVGFDIWEAGYAGMDNPGPDFVRADMAHVGHRGHLELISGDSHGTVPAYFSEHPNNHFDLVTVDGDHSRKGASLDLRAVKERVSLGGVVVFDDIVHPQHGYLADVWQREIASDQRFACWQFTELGYGVALGVRKE